MLWKTMKVLVSWWDHLRKVFRYIICFYTVLSNDCRRGQVDRQWYPFLKIASCIFFFTWIMGCFDRDQSCPRTWFQRTPCLIMTGDCWQNLLKLFPDTSHRISLLIAVCTIYIYTYIYICVYMYKCIIYIFFFTMRYWSFHHEWVG